MEFDRHRYAVWKLPHPLLLHWVLNPGLAINELLLGQRIPAVSLVDRHVKGPLVERTRVPCRECGSLHDGRLWSGKNAFGHYFGLVCPDCGAKIPSLFNVVTLILLAVGYPLWIGAKLAFERRLLDAQRVRLEEKRGEPSGLVSGKQVSGWRLGLKFGVTMGVFMLVFNLFERARQAGWRLSAEDLSEVGVIALSGAILSGAFFGIAMGIVLSWLAREKEDDARPRH